MQTNLIEVNEVNTLINDKVLSILDSQSRVEFMDLFDKIVFIKNLTSPNRKKAIDLDRWDNPNLPAEKEGLKPFRKKDSKGRIRVDLENPHILENMEYFTERAKFFKEHGKYTHLYPNSNPNSEYRKFWDEERRRCIEGYIRESDGEWIPGYYYFYLNYSPIDIVEAIDKINNSNNGEEFEIIVGGVRSERTEDFPKVWDGDYLYFHYVEQAETEGKHVTAFKCRGRGYSFKGGSMLGRNYFLVKKSKSYALASEQEYLTKDGILNKAWNIINFIDNNTPFTQPRDYKDTDMHKKASYKDVENKTERGFMSEVIGVTCKDNPNKARGKRGKLLLFEEAGKFPGLSTAWTIARKSVEQGRFVYGTMASFGTGGTKGANFEALEKFFYSPTGYNIKAMRNVFDKIGYTNNQCALFIPEYLNREGCYDKNGNSNVVKALIEILLQRQIIRNSTNDVQALIEEKAEAPITPQEAILRVEGSRFPVLDLKEYLSTITINMQRFVNPHYVGKMIIGSDGDIQFKMISGIQPIREFPLQDGNKEGAIEIYEMPVKPKVNADAYIIGIDTYDDDDVTYSTSLGSVYVFDRWTRNIVAEYTGRPQTANEFYEICYRLARFYNAKIMYENNKKGLYGYFNNVKNSIWMLADTPDYLKNKQSFKPEGFTSNTTKGVNATASINSHARELQASWMLEEVQEVTDNVDNEGNQVFKTTLRLQHIRSIGYIREAIAWSPDINCDRISAMGMVLLYDAELQQYEMSSMEAKVQSRFASDPFLAKFKADNTAKKFFGYSPS